MPEIKHQFTGGKMEKDLDERLVPNGQYRDAMNVQVATSEDSDVGTIQNILGNSNIRISYLDRNTQEAVFLNITNAKVIGAIADEKQDMLYYLLWTQDRNFIISYKRNDAIAKIIFIDDKTRVDSNGDQIPSVLKFDPEYTVTGINIIDDMIFWTDNNSEPKKINIPRSISGTPHFDHTQLVNTASGIGEPIKEEHVTVIKRGPTSPLNMSLETDRDPSLIYTAIIKISDGSDVNSVDNNGFATLGNDFYGAAFNTNPFINFSNITTQEGSNTFQVQLPTALNSFGQEIDITTTASPDGYAPAITGWLDPNTNLPKIGTKVVLKEYSDDGDVPGIPITDFTLKGVIEEAYTRGIKIKVTAIDGFAPVVPPGDTELKYAIDLYEEDENLFEFKFPRFSYRYKYEDSEYSTFAPFTQVAFIPGSFDYHPRKGYNLGMTNRLQKVIFKNLITQYTPKDVVSIDILFKDEPSPNIYVVDTISPNDYNPGTGNLWNNILNNQADFVIEKETINSVVPSNQLLRPWDNVPRKALAQDISGSRIIYGNYIQNYNLLTSNEQKFTPNFAVSLRGGPPTGVSATKSIKSLREYQLGVVFIDEHGRETPVLSNTSGTIKLEKQEADKGNKIRVKLTEFEYPQVLSHFKYFIKETSGEYYNMAMDRFYHAEDGGIWLAFPSSDRNKIDIDTFLILKKGTDSDNLVEESARYKVLAIENEAPDFIKTAKRLAGSVPHFTTSTDIFGTGLNESPLVGNDEFKMNYSPFFATAAQNLAEFAAEPGNKLYIEFAQQSTDQKSDRYRISSITNDWDGTSGTVDDAKYSIQLEEQLGDDVNFITDDPTGANPTKIENGTVVNVYKYEVENSPKFDGRFFVKIYFDETFRNNISKSFKDGLELRTTQSKRIYIMKPGDTHYDKNARDLNHLLVNNHPHTSGYGNSLWSFNHANDAMMGYYTFHKFHAFAFYFRRYQMLERYAGPNTFSRLFHLEKSSSNPIYIDKDGQGWDKHPKAVEEFGNVPWSSWSGDGDKILRVGVNSGTPGYTANFFGNVVLPSLGNIELSFNEDVTHVLESDDSARDTEVWFIDGGPYAGNRSSSNGLYWGGITTHSPPKDAPGLQEYGSGYNMTLAFGGIRGSDPGNQGYPGDDGITSTSGFFNIANWNATTNADVNPNYNTSDVENFVRNINPGFKFRWKEDPNQTIYTIAGGVSENYDRLIRHSPNKENKIHVGGTGSGATTTTGMFAFQDTVPVDEKLSMAEHLSFNFTKGWRITGIEPALTWDPTTEGQIPGGLDISLNAINSAGGTTGGNTVQGSTISEFITIYVKELSGTDATTDETATIHEGMALKKYTTGGSANDLQSHLGSNANEFLVITKINKITSGVAPNVVTYYELLLGGYDKPVLQTTHTTITTTKIPTIGQPYQFVQVGMNGWSPNSEFNVNVSCGDLSWTAASCKLGKIGAVGYTLEFVDELEQEEVLSENPAIFETEPKETKDLDIYYEASAAIPIKVNKDNIHEAFPIGTVLYGLSGFTLTASKLIGYDGVKLIFDQPLTSTIGAAAPFFRPDGSIIEVEVISIDNSTNTVEVDLENYHTNNFILDWHNCFAFGNGVESNRIRDNFNLPFISNGVKVSTTLETEYKEEHRKYGLIYSGLYNSTTGVNNLNQFIQAEKITKDVNPVYGSIQKLHARDTDLIAICEDKVLKILANKDAVFNADGNAQLTANERVLGQTVPYVGEYGISTNPESFASESYRAYFTDKVRGVVLRLSRDGLTPISDAGMKDWFRDNFKLATKAIGSFDDRNDEYNIKLQIEKKGVDESKVLSFNEKVKGWVSFKSFTKMQSGISMGNDYYTFDDLGMLYKHYDEEQDRNTFYGTREPSSFEVVLNDEPSAIKNFNTLNYEGTQAKVDKFTFETKNLPYQPQTDYTDQKYYNLFDKEGWLVESIITDKEDGYVKEFKEKEGKWFNNIRKNVELDLSKADTADFTFQGLGFSSSIALAQGSGTSPACPTPTFSYNIRSGLGFLIPDPVAINGYESYTWLLTSPTGALDVGGSMGMSASFSYQDIVNEGSGRWTLTVDFVWPQGIYTCQSIAVFEPILGCTNPNATNYDPNVNVDDGSCVIPTGIVYGCTNPSASNYDPNATVDDGSCVFAGPPPPPSDNGQADDDAVETRGETRSETIVEPKALPAATLAKPTPTKALPKKPIKGKTLFGREIKPSKY